MPPQSLPALQSVTPTAWEEAVYAFLVEKRARSGSTRTVESYARMLWPFFRVTTPDRVRPADVLAHARGIGLSGRVPSSATVGAIEVGMRHRPPSQRLTKYQTPDLRPHLCRPGHPSNHVPVHLRTRFRCRRASRICPFATSVLDSSFQAAGDVSDVGREPVDEVVVVGIGRQSDATHRAGSRSHWRLGLRRARGAHDRPVDRLIGLPRGGHLRRVARVCSTCTDTVALPGCRPASTSSSHRVLVSVEHARDSRTGG